MCSFLLHVLIPAHHLADNMQFIMLSRVPWDLPVDSHFQISIGIIDWVPVWSLAESGPADLQGGGWTADEHNMGYLRKMILRIKVRFHQIKSLCF